MTDERVEAAALPQDLWFQSAGTRLFVRSLGQGPPVVFLHGGLADHRAALVRVGGLAAWFRLLAPDLRGSGRSHYSDALSWDRLADDVLALLDHLGLPRAVVGGTSMGSAVALRFALRHPRHTAGLLLLAPVYPGSDVALTTAQSAAMRAMNAAGQRTRVHGIEALLPLYDALPAELRERAVAMARQFDPASVAATTEFLASDAQPLASARDLASITAPTLIVPGSDPEHPPQVATLYARHLPDVALVDAAEPALLPRLAEFCRRAFGAG